MTTIKRIHWIVQVVLLASLLVACTSPITQTTLTATQIKPLGSTKSRQATPTKLIAVQRPQTPTPITIQGIGSPADIGVCILTLRDARIEYELQGTSLARNQVSPFMKFTPKQDDAVFLVAVLGSNCGPIYANGFNARVGISAATSYAPALYGLQCFEKFYSESPLYLPMGDDSCDYSNLDIIFIIPATATTQELLVSIQIGWLGENNTIMNQEIRFRVSVKE